MLRRRLDPNFLPNIDRLSSEIMSNIFLYVHSEYRNTSFDLPVIEANTENANSFIVVAHVSRRWRTIAHRTKALWRRITLSGGLSDPAYLATSFFMLSHPLSIQLEHDFDHLSDIQIHGMNFFYDLLIRNPHRIAGLYLRGYLPYNAWYLIHLPLTNILEVELAFTEDDHEDSLGNWKVVNFLGGISPTLQKLSLTDYIWPRGSTFPSLTNLHIKREYYDESLATDDFYELMRSLSRTLRVLCVDTTRTPGNSRGTLIPDVGFLSGHPNQFLAAFCPDGPWLPPDFKKFVRTC